MDDSNSNARSSDEVLETLAKRALALRGPEVSEPVGGFPASLIESLRNRNHRFDAEQVLACIRDGADLLAELPMVYLSREMPGEEYGTYAYGRLDNLSMFSILLFRRIMENRSSVRTHYPKHLDAIPRAGFYSVFDNEGVAIVQAREMNILEYAALTTDDERMFQLITASPLLNRESPQVREGMTRALDVFITGGGVCKPKPIDQMVHIRARNMAAMILAGADPGALRHRDHNDPGSSQLRLLQLLINALGGKKCNPKSGTNLRSPDGARVESAIEMTLKPNPNTGALLFDIDQRNPATGRTLLHDAAEYAGPRAVEALLHAGADIDAEADIAVAVEAGADGNVPGSESNRSVTPMSLAQAAGEHEVVAMLKAWKAKRAVAKAIGNVVRHRTLSETSS
jgi:hypothetical protein